MFSSALIISILGGYLFGAIPFGLFIARLFGQGDIRNIGSGNIGATNVLRTGRKDLAFLTLILDAGKAGLAAIIFHKILGAPFGLIAGSAALLGHCYPIWLKFKGGKGVATFLGALLAVGFPIGLGACLVWLAMFFLTKISSLSALVAAASAPLIAYFMGREDIALMALSLAIVIFVRHRENIKRIIAGTEPRSDGHKTTDKI